jgi:hypothetical protein
MVLNYMTQNGKNHLFFCLSMYHERISGMKPNAQMRRERPNGDIYAHFASSISRVSFLNVSKLICCSGSPSGPVMMNAERQIAFHVLTGGVSYLGCIDLPRHAKTISPIKSIDSPSERFV